MGWLWTTIALLGTLLLAAACLALPAAVAGVEAFSVGQWADAGLSVRRLGLLCGGLYIAFAAALLAQFLGAGLAAGLAVRRPTWVRRLTSWLGLVVLLTPPYIYAYAWSLPLLPEGVYVGAPGATFWPHWLTGAGRAVWCLATWCSPVAAIVLFCGWEASGRGALQLAALDASPPRAVVHVLIRALAGWLAISIAAVLMLALTEYSVCHLCLVQTWNTEVLSEVQVRPIPGQALPLVWPLIAVLGLVAAALWPLRHTLERLLEDAAALDEDRWSLGSAGSGRRWGVAVSLVTVVVLLLPWAVLISRLHHAAAFAQVWRTYPREWVDGLCYATVAALLAVALAVGTDFLLTWARQRRQGGTRCLLLGCGYMIAALAVVGAMMPPALVGDAFAAAFGPTALTPLTRLLGWGHVIDFLGRSWLIISLLGVARYAAIPIIALRVVGRSISARTLPSAQSDGASWRQAYVHVQLPQMVPLLVFTGLVAALLVFTEVAATQMIRPPNVDSLALTLLNAIHYGRDDQIIAMCLYLMAFVGLAVAATQLYAHARSGPSRR